MLQSADHLAKKQLDSLQPILRRKLVELLPHRKPTAVVVELDLAAVTQVGKTRGRHILRLNRTVA